jgi:PAS domain S-box-containing protein
MRKLNCETLAAMIEAAPDALVCVAADGLIVLVNAETVRLYGYPREELIGQPVELLVPDHLRAEHEQHRARYLADPWPRPMGLGMQLSGRRRDGHVFPAEISLAAIAIDGDLLTMASIRDITERLAAQAERERLQSEAEQDKAVIRSHQAQRLEALGQLAGGVAHDFNNLLAVILNYASFAAQDLTATGSDWPTQRETARHDLEQVTRAAERAADLTRQLLALGRREVVRPQVLDVNAVVNEVNEILRRTIGEHIHLETSLASDLWPVMADPGQLEQVLVSLAANARDAMPEGGTLTIETSNIVVDEESIAGGSKAQPGRNVRLRISDTGIGMTRDVLDHAFDPFYTTKDVGAGAGLGLATAYGIVTQVGGQIQAWSEPGAGTTFTVTIPATTQARGSKHTVEAYRRASAGETILVVEDEPALREVTRRILCRNGYRVITAENGPEALKVARDHPGDIHLLVTDVIMPQMLGKKVAEEIRQIRPGVGVLFMSAYARPVLAAQGRLDPDVALLEKPFSEADLVSMAGLVLDGYFFDRKPSGDESAG